ncbi:MAG TPA: isoamylase [Thermoanaerobaculia bacterium]|nr:isoamylase [Thermoanaerobaculia bacterium]
MIQPFMAPRETGSGRPFPLGVTRQGQRLNFAIYSSNSTRAWLVIVSPDGETPDIELGAQNRSGDIWHIELEAPDSCLSYGWRFGRADSDQRIHRFDPSRTLIDPHCEAVLPGSLKERSPLSLFSQTAFDWQGVAAPAVPADQRVIYELHVRGFTRDPSSAVDAPGTFQGVIEKIPYLQRLGITTVELLPIMAFDEASINREIEPDLRSALTNFWGYNPISFFATHPTFAAGGDAVVELKTMVRELHRAGIEVFLDVVFNHSAEGEGHPWDPTCSFRGIDNAVYYILDSTTGSYRNFSGCGNTINCNHPAVRRHIRESLIYWTREIHVDGFRFDLASILTRGVDGEPLSDPPLIRELSEEPLLGGSVFIAEAWDAAGLYQVGSFPGGARWLEWNGPYRDDVRRFLRGDEGWSSRLATRMTGSSDLYEHSGRTPLHSINFVTCHDGFTLADLVSFDRKHNEANGERNRDGSNDNFSWNCGIEGETDDPQTVELRRRLQLNALSILLLSQGTPMLLAGDEIGRTQHGNNNAYCQDNEISWVDWRLAEFNGDLFEFTRRLIAFRRDHPVLRQNRFLTPNDVTWHGVRIGEPDFSRHSRSLAMHLSGSAMTPHDCDVYFVANAWREALRFEIPPLPGSMSWARQLDTAAPTRDAFSTPEKLVGLSPADHVVVSAYSCILLRSM